MNEKKVSTKKKITKVNLKDISLRIAQSRKPVSKQKKYFINFFNYLFSPVLLKK